MKRKKCKNTEKPIIRILYKALLPAALCFALCFGCRSGKTGTTESKTDGETQTDSEYISVEETDKLVQEAMNKVKFEDDSNTISDETTCTITLKDDNTTCEGSGASYKKGVLSITKAGTYRISGSLSEGRIEIDADRDDLVQLILAGAEITSSKNAPISVLQAEETVICLEKGTTNALNDKRESKVKTDSDYDTNAEDNDEMKEDGYSAALYSKDDLIICGDGELIVKAGYNDGISGKDAVILLSGSIDIIASDEGIVGKDCIFVKTAEIKMDAADDALHSDQTISINGGSMEVKAGDDFLHADCDIVINGGTLTAESCNEGIEACTITINDGYIFVTSKDDGINAASMNSSVENENFNIGPGGQRMESETTENEDDSSITPLFTMNGGYLYVNAAGDGLDSNGSIIMTGGTAIVDGPVNDGNGTLDYDKSFDISGGILIAAGSSGMLQAPSVSSKQYSVAAVFDSVKQAGTLVNISDANGNSIATYAPSKNFTSVIVSTPTLKSEEVYTISTGGMDQSASENGYYEKSRYQDGTQLAQFTLSYVTTKVTSQGATEMNQQGMGNGMPGNMGGRR